MRPGQNLVARGRSQFVLERMGLLVLPAINEMIDVSTVRTVMLRAHLPATIKQGDGAKGRGNDRNVPIESEALQGRQVPGDERLLLRACPALQLTLAVTCRYARRPFFGVDEGDRTTPSCEATRLAGLMQGQTDREIRGHADVDEAVGTTKDIDEMRHARGIARPVPRPRSMPRECVVLLRRTNGVPTAARVGRSCLVTDWGWEPYRLLRLRLLSAVRSANPRSGHSPLRRRVRSRACSGALPRRWLAMSEPAARGSEP